MLNRTWILVLVLLAVAGGCSKKEKSKPETASPSVSAPAAAGGAEKSSRAREFRAAKYTDDGKWLNGINRQRPSQFIISIGKEVPTPFIPGYRLRFAKSGPALITQVHRLDAPDNSSIFITVDRDLDPAGDGHPHPILIESLSVQACRFSKETLWRNGISLTQPGTFLLMVEKKAHVPFKAGDRLKFAAAGEAVIKRVFRDENGGKFSRVFITVDRSLDPEGDGNPKWIEFEM